MKQLALALVFAALGTLGTPSHASTVSYFMDQSNEDMVLPDGVDYLRVDIAEVGDDIRFSITIQEPLRAIATSNFGLQAFGFNVGVGSTPVNPSNNISGLPDGWTARSGQQQDGFGMFELVSSGTGDDRISPTLTFFIVGIDGDRPEDYAAYSGGAAGQGNQFFAARVAGFDAGDGVESAFFGGSTVVPLPASVWLLGSALGLLGWIRRARGSAEEKS